MIMSTIIFCVHHFSVHVALSETSTAQNFAALTQDQEPARAGSEARSRRRLVLDVANVRKFKGRLALSGDKPPERQGTGQLRIGSNGCWGLQTCGA